MSINQLFNIIMMMQIATALSLVLAIKSDCWTLGFSLVHRHGHAYKYTSSRLLQYVQPSAGPSAWTSDSCAFSQSPPHPSFKLKSTQQENLESTQDSTFSVPEDWKEQLLEKLSTVVDPDLNQDIVSLGFIQNLRIAKDGCVAFDIQLTTPACPIKEQFQRDCYELVMALHFVKEVQITMTSQPMATKPSNTANAAEEVGTSQVRNIIAVSSCKGGVGKSTTSVNLAFALQKLGARVGILDADVYGPSLPTMVTPQDDTVQFVGRQIQPLKGPNGVKLMSFGYVNDGAAVMRGPMVDQLLQQFLTVVHWGELDYLILDMPPGTGDIQLTLSQKLNITAAVIVTTPQELSFVDVARGIDMFGSVEIPCVAVVENMAYYQNEDNNQHNKSTLQDDAHLQKALISKLQEYNVVLDQDKILQLTSELTQLFHKPTPANDKVWLFGKGHLDRLSTQYGIDNTFSMPLLPDIASSGDAGTPYIVKYPDSPQAQVYIELASSVVREVAKLQYSSASRRLLVEYDSESGLLKIIDSSQTIFGLKPVTLRRECKCAVCVEEMTGRQLLNKDTISEKVKPREMVPYGNYALSVNWSDGHRSLYPYKQIKALAGIPSEVKK